LAAWPGAERTWWSGRAGSRAGSVGARGPCGLGGLERGDDGKAALLGPSGYVPRGYSAGVTNPSIIESVVAAAAATADKLDGGSMRVRHFSVPQLEVAPNSPNLHTLCISMASDLPKELFDLATFQIGEGQGAAVKSCVQPTTHGLPNPCVPQHDRATSKLQFEGSHSQGESLCDLQRTETGLRERDIVATEAPTHFARVERGSETLQACENGTLQACDNETLQACDNGKACDNETLQACEHETLPAADL
jgi:hypothetical protein